MTATLTADMPVYERVTLAEPVEVWADGEWIRPEPGYRLTESDCLVRLEQEFLALLEPLQRWADTNCPEWREVGNAGHRLVAGIAHEQHLDRQYHRQRDTDDYDNMRRGLAPLIAERKRWAAFWGEESEQADQRDRRVATHRRGPMPGQTMTTDTKGK